MGIFSPIKDVALRTRERFRPSYDRFLHGFANRHGKRAWVRDVNFDLVARCNLRCRYCSLDHDAATASMDLELLTRVLDEISDRRRFRVTRIQLHHGADPLLHPKFADVLGAIAERKGREGFPEVRLLTNAMLLQGARKDAIFDSGAIDFIRFSIDGGTPENFERMRPPAKWDKVAGNVEAFLEENESRGKPLRTGMISLFDRPPGDLHPRFEALSRRVTHYMPRMPHRWDGSADLDLPTPPEIPAGLCMFVLVQVVVRYDGQVLPCCNDLNARGPVGNLADSSLFDIVRGAERERLVRLMKQGKRSEIELCKNCDIGLG